MAFFAGLSSSIGKKLLLFGLRHIDILDKDPADFVSVDVGKRTTLEVRDVGLHVKKLVALLHVDLPPEIHLSKARASLLRVTFVFDFGVPEIIIEIDGVQVHARLAEETDSTLPKPPGSEADSTPLRKSSPFRRQASSPPPVDSSSDVSDEDEYVPTVDDLAKSFIREEPEEEIRELEEALNTKSEYMQESVVSSEDSEEDGSEGIGAPLALPAVLRNILNTALDRLQIIASHIDIQVDDQFPTESTNTAGDVEDPCVSLNFHVDRIAIDSVTSQDPSVDVAGSTATTVEPNSKLGKRRMRLENLYARLISDAENFASPPKVSRPSSSVDARSEISSSQKPQSDISASRVSTVHESRVVPEENVPPAETALPDLQEVHSEHTEHNKTHEHVEHNETDEHDDAPLEAQLSEHQIDQLASSVLTTDEDRFADATSDDGMDASTTSDLPEQFPYDVSSRDMTASSILYDDEGVLDYAIENDLLDSRIHEETPIQSSARETALRVPATEVSATEESATEESAAEEPTAEELATEVSATEELAPGKQSVWKAEASGFSNESRQSSIYPSASELLLSSTIERSTNLQHSLPQPRQSQSSAPSKSSKDNLDSARHHAAEAQPPNNFSTSSVHSASASEEDEDLTESRVFNHDDAESLYMSAMSGAPLDSSHRPDIPGGWDSASTSSQDTGSDTSAPIPASMIHGSILGSVPEADDGCETPRPGSRQSAASSPVREHHPSAAPNEPRESVGLDNKLARLFLTVDTVTIWFPLGLEDNQPSQEKFEPEQDHQLINFSPPNLGDDSIFQDMPGSFSNYAQSTASKRKGSIDFVEAKRRPDLKASAVAKPPESSKNKFSPTINVEVGTVTGHMDLSTGRAMYQIFDRVLKATTAVPDRNKNPTKKQPAPLDKRMSMDVSVKHVAIAWLERLMAESIIGNAPSPAVLDLEPTGAILSLSLSSIHVASESTTQDARTKLTIGKFALSSLNQEIFSFHSPKARSRRSVSGTPDLLKNDIEIDYEQGKDRRITIVTRPVMIAFDLQKLDEALSSFGGFSGVLEVGSSISSSNSNSPKAAISQNRPRGVHFGDSPSIPPPTDTSAMPKVQIQFGEVSLALKGKSCALQLHTTSVRIAVRESNLRLKVSEVHLSGPYVDGAEVGPPLIVEVKGTTVNFLFTPEEVDLTRLISMITPSKDPYENDEDILIDTLLRQRRKGSVLRAEITSVGLRLSDLNQLQILEALGAEVARLSKVAKYLPDDDRPGILTLASVQRFDANVMINERLGAISVALQGASIAQVGVPALLAVEIGKLCVSRDEEILVHEVVHLRTQDQLPMIMVRMIGDEMEPIIKAKMFNLCAEYHVTTVMAALGIAEEGTVDDIALGLASSVATVTGTASPKTLSRQSSGSSALPSTSAKPLHVDLLLRSCALGLNPRKLPSKCLFVLTDAHFSGKQAKDTFLVEVGLRKASIHAIDDVRRIEQREMAPAPQPISTAIGHRQLLELHDYGYVSLSTISAANINVKVEGDGKENPQVVDVQFKNELFYLESCADSTQTLIGILNGLAPPAPPNTAERYRTVVPLQQMMESFTGDAVNIPENFDENFMENADLVADEVPTNLEFVGSFYNQGSMPTEEDVGDSLLGEDDLGVLAGPPITHDRGENRLLDSFQEQYEVDKGEEDFDFEDQYFKDSGFEPKGTARKWDSKKGKYSLKNEFTISDAPLRVRIRDMNIVWNLHDGYDWPRTRGIIAQAVEDVEARAEERRRRPKEEDDDEDFVEQDFLFNSVWVGIPVKDEKGTLARRINHDIDDLVSETGSYAASTATGATGATARPRSANKPHRRRLKLERSKQKKIQFSLSGLAVDLVVYPPDSGETQNSLDVRVRDFEIYDHIPTSTWKKFCTSLIDPSMREMDKPMINLEVLTVKPVTDLAASELVISVKVSPLRLHVDQDALDFITRFFEFKDDSVPVETPPGEQPFIQRLNVEAVTLKLDYKPKRVDYRGLRSGHTTEFMNFLILDGSDIVLRHAIVFGITSFDRLHKTLNDVWMPDVRRNQLPYVLSGLAAVRPIVNVGSGIKDLVYVPMKEYKKDGRILRSLEKGAYAFAKNTTTEVARLGARVAIGTQNILEGAEKFLSAPTSSLRSHSTHDWDGSDPEGDDEEPRAISNYANQPIGVRAGLRNAVRYLERDLLTARDAVIAIPAEVIEEGTGLGMAKAIARRAPTVIIRPALGATKAVSNTLLGVGNALDKESKRKIEDKYKSY